MNAESSLSLALPISDAPVTAPRHLLVLAPSMDLTHGLAPDQESLTTVSRWLTQFGYVYLAQEGQKNMEDDEFGVRHMPLRAEALPTFGDLTLAVVFDSMALLQEAQRQYPETLITFVESASTVSVQAQLATMILRRAAD